MKRHIWRCGDQVKVIRTSIVKRVGYPLVWTDLQDEVEADPRTYEAWRVLTAPTGPVTYSELTASLNRALTLQKTNYPHEFIRAICMQRVRERRFGGDERGLHFYKVVPDDKLARLGEEVHSHDGEVHTVYDVRRVQIGHRYAPRGGVTYSHDGPDEWYEAGGLENRRTVTLLHLSHCGEISTDDVELVQKAPKK